MPQGLNVESSIVGQPDLGGAFYKAGSLLERQKDREDEESQKADSRKQQMTKFLTDYLDPKDRLTGTNYDPMIAHGFNDLLSKGIQLAGTGADSNTIMTALMPGVQKLDAYSTNAKLVNNQIKGSLAKLKSFKGYNTDALEQEAKKQAFYNSNGTLKDPTTIDPNHDWISEAVKSNPLGVTTSEGIENYAKNDGKQTRDANIVTTDNRGNKTTHKLSLSAANWEQPEVDEQGNVGIVPKYQVATDNKNPIQHDFTDASGNVTKAPVRLFNEGEFNKMMASNPAIADHIIGLTKQHIGEYKDANGKPIDLNDPRASIVARAIAYDYLKSSGNSTIHRYDAQQLSPQQIRINLTGTPYAAGKSGTGAGAEYVNAFKDVSDRVKDTYTPHPLNTLPMDTQLTLLETAKKLRPDDGLDQTNTYVSRDSAGNLNLFKDNGKGQPDELMATLSSSSMNLAVNKGGGVKVKQAIIHDTKGTAAKSEDLRKKYNY